MYGAPPGYGPPPGQGDPNRFIGRIKSFNPEKGFGFIDCPQAHDRWQRDVFIHKRLIGDLQVGEEVTFEVEPNKEGMPQARSIARADGRPVGAGDGKGCGKGGGKKKRDQKKAKGKGDGKGGKGGKAKGNGDDKSETKGEDGDGDQSQE